MPISKRSLVIPSILTFFSLGLLVIVVSIYVAWRDGVGLSLATFSLIGFVLIIFSFIIYSTEYLDYREIVIRDKVYSLKSSPEEKAISSGTHSERLENVIPLLNQISEQMETSERELSELYYENPLQQSINIINKQLAIWEYKKSVEDDDGLRVVEFSNDRVVAISEEELGLAEGLKFHILSDDSDESLVNGRIATAELVETESTSGTLFEFNILKWKKEDEDWISRATVDLENGHARMRIITDDFVELEEETLETTLSCLQNIKHEQELEYDY